MRHWIVLVAVAATAGLEGQQPAVYEGRAATLVENDRLEVTVLSRGGAFASLVLKDDPERMNPMWNPIRLARESGGPARFGDSIGHFVCVDGFGPSSKEEQAAGLMGHGEAHRLLWERVSAGREGGATTVVWRVNLPLVQEVFTREVRVVEGEQVVYVTSKLESLVGFDRPVSWAEHATIGAPFLAPVVTVVDASVGQCQTRPHDGRPPRTLAPGREFRYPEAPLLDGGTRNLRAVPAAPRSMDHTGCLLDPQRRLAFITALRTDTRLLFGYLVRREDYPWLQEWMNYTAAGTLARGLEFGTQPYDVPRRQTVDWGKLFGMPTFRWLPAKSTIEARFLMFLVRAPDGFLQVDDVRQEGGQLIVEDRRNGRRITLRASIPL